MKKNQVNSKNSTTTDKVQGRSPIVLKREQQKYLPDHPNRIKVNGVDSGGQSTSFGQTSLSEVKYWYYMFNERSGLDDPSVPLYSSFASDFKFGSIREKVMNKATTQALQNSKFNPDQHFTNPKHKRKNTFPSTLMISGSSAINSDNIEPKELPASLSSRQSYTSNSSVNNIPSIPTNLVRPSSASISLRKKAASVSLPVRPMSARVGKSTNNNFISISVNNPANERVVYNSPEKTRSSLDLDEIASNISQVSKIESISSSKSPYSFNTPPIPNKTFKQSTTSSNTRKELSDSIARPTSARLSGRSEFTPPPDIAASRVDNSKLRIRPQSSYNSNQNRYTVPHRPQSASVLT